MWFITRVIASWSVVCMDPLVQNVLLYLSSTLMS